MAKSQSISDEEIALIKAMLTSGKFPKDQIQAFFTRPDRVMNYGRISDIEQGRRGAQVKPATQTELEEFVRTWTPGRGALPKAESDPFSETLIETLLRIDCDGGRVKANETDRVEFKRSWNAGSISEYARSIAAFANNRGGYLIFGIEDGTGEIVGLTSRKFGEYDPAQISERLHALVQPQVDFEKTVATLCGKTIGLIYVAEARTKPIYGVKDASPIEDGAVYFRYPGETRRIRHLDLAHIITERERQLSAAISDKVARITEVGPHDAAILNTSAGELELSGRSLLLSEPLREQVSRLARGEYQSEDETFELAGTVGLRGAAHTIIKGRISDYDLVRDFIDRARVANPFDYIRHFLDTQTVWLPLFWFVLLYGKPIPQLIAELGMLPALKPKSWMKLRARLEGGRSQKQTYVYPSARMLASLKEGQPIKATNNDQAMDAMKTLFAVEISEHNKGAIFKTLEGALTVFDSNGNLKLFERIRYAASFVDQELYRKPCLELGKEPMAPASSIK
jgi:hypothetical protein